MVGMWRTSVLMAYPNKSSCITGSTSIIVAAELRYGCAKSGSKRLLKAVEDLLGEIDVLPFDVPADSEYGRLRSELESVGKPIGGNDLLIAAHAYATAATIVTGYCTTSAKCRCRMSHPAIGRLTH